MSLLSKNIVHLKDNLLTWNLNWWAMTNIGWTNADDWFGISSWSERPSYHFYSRFFIARWRKSGSEGEPETGSPAAPRARNLGIGEHWHFNGLKISITVKRTAYGNTSVPILFFFQILFLFVCMFLVLHQLQVTSYYAYKICDFTNVFHFSCFVSSDWGVLPSS